MPLLLNGREARGSVVADYLRIVGLEGRQDDLPSALSGGEQQRVAVVRALIHGPDIILADEPTGNLDSRTGMPIVRLIKDAAARDGKTVVMATHNRAVADFAERIIRIRDGAIE